MIPFEHILVISTGLFFIGAAGFLIRKNMIMMLISLELMLNGVSINFVVFNKYIWPGQLEGVFFSIFIIAMAAAETAVAIAIILNIYRNFKSVDVDKPGLLKY
jgi:NADH:ubiquinone oxidoreductase subunit K